MVHKGDDEGKTVDVDDFSHLKMIVDRFSADISFMKKTFHKGVVDNIMENTNHIK